MSPRAHLYIDARIYRRKRSGGRRRRNRVVGRELGWERDRAMEGWGKGMGQLLV
jgi:hypothetical protein